MMESVASVFLREAQPVTKQDREQQREAVKVLAIAVGVREAARQTGVNENTILSWSKRDKWFVDPPKPKTVVKQNGHAISAIKSPSAGLQTILEQRKVKVKSNLSKYLVNASNAAARSRSPLADSGDVKNVSTVMATLYPEKEQQGSGVMGGLRVYSQQTVIQVDQRDQGLT